MDIETLLEGLLDREGGYANHPDDRGGETCWGITEAVARSHGYAGSMRDLSRDEARAMYRKTYWTRPGFDRVAMIAPALAAELFDTGVNMGCGVAAGFLQRTLNVLNRRGRDWPDIAVDRTIGPRTLAALRALVSCRGRPGELIAVKTINALQGAHYVDLAEKRPANESFVFGWLRHRV